MLKISPCFALSGGKDAAVWDTLAAAYAETGKFADAVLAAKRALALARESQANLENAIRNRLRLYEANEPFRDNVAANR